MALEQSAPLDLLAQPKLTDVTNHIRIELCADVLKNGTATARLSLTRYGTPTGEQLTTQRMFWP
jgi:hypothetical protein